MNSHYLKATWTWSASMNILAAMQRWITRLDQSFLGAVGGVTAEVLVCCRLLILRLFCSLLSMSTPIEAMGDIVTMLMMFGCIVCFMKPRVISSSAWSSGWWQSWTLLKQSESKSSRLGVRDFDSLEHWNSRRVNVRGLELGMSTVVNFEAIGEYVEKGLM